ncbi:hypothetical protein CONCODRAFT_9127, partial [Conidiobolus coronatus NRRL 28638]
RRIGTLSNLQPINVSSICTQLDFSQINSILNLNKLQTSLLNATWPIDSNNTIVNNNKFPLIVNKQFNNIDEVFNELDMVKSLKTNIIDDNNIDEDRDISLSHSILQSDKGHPFSYQVFKPNQQFKRSQLNPPNLLIYALE